MPRSIYSKLSRLDHNRIQFQEILVFFPGRKLRLTLISAEFREGCSAVAHVWDKRSQEWHELHSIPPLDTQVPTCLHVAHDPSPTSFWADREELLGIAGKVR